MIKKIFSYIIIGIFLLLPNLGFAKIIELTTISVNNSDITSDSVKVFGTIRQQKNPGEGNPSTPPQNIYGGFTIPQKSNQIITSCTQLPKPQLSQLTISKIEDNDTDIVYFYSLNKTFTNLQEGETYYFCFAGIEGKDNKDSNQYTYGNVKSFSTKPTLDLNVNGATEKIQVNYGGNVEVNWTSKGANLCIAKNDLSFINGPTAYGSQGIAPIGKKTIDKIYERKVFTIECLSKNGYGSATKSVEVTIKGKDENSIGKVSTLPTDKKTEPEFEVKVTDKSATLKGKLDSLLTSTSTNPSPEHCKNGIKDENETGTDIGGSCTGAYAYFRISKITIPPLFCNDIFGSNMIAVTATNQGNTKIPGGKLKGAGEFSGTIYTLEPDTDYAYCAIVSNHPVTPTEIEYGQVVRFRTNPCFNCPHTTVRTLRPTQISNSSAILQGNYNSTRNIKVWFEYRPKWGGLDVPVSNDGGIIEVETLQLNKLDILQNNIFGINAFNSSKLGISILKNLIKSKEAKADLNQNTINNEWYKIKDSESVYSKKRNYGRKQFTLTGLSRDTTYQYRIVAETVQDKILYPNPNPVQKFEGAIVEFKTKSVNDGVNPLAHCYNGIQDLGETGVDTGGGCPGKAPSCDDGIQNQNETSIDQGGVCKDNPIASCTNGIQDFGETDVDTGGPCEDPGAPDCPEGEVCGCPTGYVGTYPDCFPPALPTCDDGIQNNDETGVDTGGSCDQDPADPSCVDGILNQDETEIDTGGVCGENAPDHCFNGVQDEDETGIDKGGSCGNDPRPNRCKNGIQDGDETGIDTGGRCGDKVTVDIKATSYYIPKGGRTTVKWTSTNADYCVIPGYRSGGRVETTGEFSPINITEKQRTYTATCTSAKYGTGSDSITIFTYEPTNSDFVSVDIKAKPTYLVKKGNVDITWTSKNAASCVAHGPVIEGKTELNGGYGIPDIIKSSTWSVDCIGTKGGRASDSVFVFVDQGNSLAHCFNNVQDEDETGIDTGGSCKNTNDERVTVDIKASPEVLTQGKGTVISWTSTNATSCVVTDYKNGKSVEPNSQGFGVKLDQSKSYTATCKGINGGVGSDTVNVLVFPPTKFVTVDVKAEKSTLIKGGETEISWTSTNATSCTSSGGGGTGTSGTFKTGALQNSKTFSVTCRGGTNVVPNTDSVFIAINTSNNDDDDNNGGDCEEGWVEENGSCVPTYICPTGSTGVWPNCKYKVDPLPCPTTTGWTGTTWPNCKYTGKLVPCPITAGWSGTNWPDCKYSGDGTTGENNGTPCPTTKGWSGDKWPNCKYSGDNTVGYNGTACPKTAGWTGTTWPNCKYSGGGTGGNNGNPCPTTKGWSGDKWPNCKYASECPNGWTGTWPNCTFIRECPTGTTGEYPNCKIDNNNDNNGNGNGNNGNGTGTGGNGGTDGNCPIGYTGNPPTCIASTTCPNGWTGTWPNCKYVGNGTGTGGNGGNNNGNGNNNDGNGNNNDGNNGNSNDGNGTPTTCPISSTGTFPNCTFTETCPAGFTGVWPVCTSGPTTNIAHCSNGVQDFGETAIDIGGGCGGVYNSGATCFDNIKNGDETGIDEGGHCGDGPNNNGEYPSCFDNIKNGDETGIDSGGHCGNPNNGTDWVDVIFPDANGNGTTTGNCVNGVCNGNWDGNFPGLDGPFSGSCRAGTYTDCTFTGNCVNGFCTGTWNGNFPGQNGPFIGTINGGLGDGRGLNNNDWIDTVFTGLSGEGNLDGECLNGICKGKWKGVAFNKNGPIAGVWNSPNGTGPFIGECKENVCSGTWSGVIPGNNGELIGKWKGDGVGPDDGKELYIGYEGIPDVDDIVRYHEGIEHVFIRRIMINTELARHYGYQKGQNLLQFAWELAHTFAKEFGYVNSEGNEIRVSQPDVSAYQLRLVGDKLTVYEYYKNKIIDLRERTTVFKNKNSYEYYFEKP